MSFLLTWLYIRHSKAYVLPVPGLPLIIQSLLPITDMAFSMSLDFLFFVIELTLRIVNIPCFVNFSVASMNIPINESHVAFL